MPRGRRWQEHRHEARANIWPQEGCWWRRSALGCRCCALRVGRLRLRALTRGGGCAAHARAPPAACCREASH
eukprot:7501251-Alexandrium_andersonii.AAC.1